MKRDFQTHAAGLGFPEGPVALADGSIAFVDLLHARIRAWRGGEIRVLADLPGAPNGMRLGPDGALYIANNGGIAPATLSRLHYAEPQIPGCIQKLSTDGTMTVLAGNLPGVGPHRPNDLVFTPEGEIVFTDPQNWEVLGLAPESYHGGQLLIAGGDGAVRIAAAMSGFPNGLAFHPDGSLIVGITLEHRLLRFEWRGGDRLGLPTEWSRLHEGFNPDGMVFHGDRLYAAGSVGDQIAVIGLDGKLIELIDTGEGSDPTNLCVHDGRLWVTCGIAGTLVSTSLEN